MEAKAEKQRGDPVTADDAVYTDGPLEGGRYEFGGEVTFTVHARRRKGVAAHMATVTLVTDEPDSQMASFLSINDMLFDGQPFPWFTMGAAKIELERRDVAKITLTIPVKLVAARVEP